VARHSINSKKHKGRDACCRKFLYVPGILFGRAEGKHVFAKVVLRKWLLFGELIIGELRGKNSRIYQEERWKFAEKVAFCFAMMYFGRKSKSNVVHFRGVKLHQKHVFLISMKNKLK